MTYPRLLTSVFVKRENENEAVYDISHNGIGVLKDCVSCEVTEERNRTFTLKLVYPVGGVHWDVMDVGQFVVCKPNKFESDQPFRIVDISKASGGNITVTAHHISYDMRGVVTRGFNAGTSGAFANGVNSESYDSSGESTIFTFSTDIQAQAHYVSDRTPPRTMRSVLLDTDNSFVSLFGGEFKFDGYNVYALQSRGKDKGTIIHSNSSLAELTWRRSIRDFATAVYPFWYSEIESEQYLELPEKVLHFGTAEYSDVEKVVPLNLSYDFDQIPTEEQLREAATAWVNRSWESNPPVNLKISIVDQNVGEISLCDIVTIVSEVLNKSIKAKVIKIVYDVLNDTIKNIAVGDSLPDLEDTFLRVSRKKLS